MTIEEKARAYDEALKRADSLTEKYGGREFAEYVFPELKESEDESMLWTIIRGFENWKSHGNLTFNNTKVDDIIVYLEKQKDLDKMIVVSPEVWDKAIADAYDNGKKEGEKQKEPHYTKRNALFDKCMENCDPKTVEEVNKRVDDIMNMPKLSPFEQALTNFIGDWEDDEEHWPSQFVKKHGKHILDIAREELQKEQKPVEQKVSRSQIHHELLQNGTITMEEYLKLTENLYFPRKQRQGWDEFDEDCLKRAIWYIENPAPSVVKDTNLALWLKSLPERFNLEQRQEWNDEDEDAINGAIGILLDDNNPNFVFPEHSKLSVGEIVKRLKSLRPQPHWKPSKEQMEALRECGECKRCIKNLYDQLKKLM